MTSSSQPWFKNGTLYQIYPRSFYDTSGNGTGDLRGVIQKLDHLAGQPDSLAVDAIWIAPFYPSPMADFGYDVSDYREVDPRFGTLDDFRELLEASHQRGLKVVIDFIPNHSSNQHDWFKQSRSSRDNPKRGWYVWHDSLPDGSPPNNWQSVFSGPAWTLDDTTGQYYLHTFLPEQPDLNWDNPAVRQAMIQHMKFWLDMGVDGFRVDSAAAISKDPGFRDDPPNNDFVASIDPPGDSLLSINSQNGPQVYEYLKVMTDVVASYPNRFMILEVYPEGWENQAGAYLDFYRQVNSAVCAPFNFEGISAPWQARTFEELIDRFQSEIKPEYTPVYCFGNHDRSRLATRRGPEAARVAAMLLLTLPGLSTIYNGDELGMVDGTITPDQVHDPFEKRAPGQGNGRDPERTPMLWNNQTNAGFTTGQPWLPIDPNFGTRNVDSQSAEPTSILNLYRRLIELRNTLPSLKKGEYKPLQTPKGIFGFQRIADREIATILLNFTGQTIELGPGVPTGKVIASTYMDNPPAVVTALRPNEGIICKL
ncbi:MAG: alpha-amylase family glycosyl hydrolase [Candidatus Saccharimonadales bacterium]